jgi:hypothetical protein
VLLAVVVAAEQLLGDRHRGRDCDADRGAGEGFLAGREAFLFLVVLHHEPPCG